MLPRAHSKAAKCQERGFAPSAPREPMRLDSLSSPNDWLELVNAQRDFNARAAHRMSQIKTLRAKLCNKLQVEYPRKRLAASRKLPSSCPCDMRPSQVPRIAPRPGGRDAEVPCPDKKICATVVPARVSRGEPIQKPRVRTNPAGWYFVFQDEQ